MLINPEAESMLLAGFLKAPQRVGALCVEKNLSSEAFSSQDSKQLYRFLLGVWSSGVEIQPYRIAMDLRKAGMIEAIGGPDRLQGLTMLFCPLEGVGGLIDDLKDLQVRRRLFAAVQSVHEDVQGITATGELIGRLNAAISVQEDSNVSTPSPAELNKLLLDHAERSTVIPTGFRAIDSECGALYPGDFLVIAGGAKAGKSTLAANIATNISRNRFVAVFTIEMNRIEFWRRIVTAAAGVSGTYWHPESAVSQWAHNQISGSMRALENARITVIDQVTSIEHAIALARCLKVKHGEIGAVVFDYLQMFSSSEKTNTRAEAVAGISRACKRAAVELQTLVIGVSQLNDDGKSLESRGIQRDANLMLNVLVEDDGTRKVVSAFNRNGPMGMLLKLKAELNCNRFVDEP